MRFVVPATAGAAPGLRRAGRPARGSADLATRFENREPGALARHRPGVRGAGPDRCSPNRMKFDTKMETVEVETKLTD
jgi:hypothetical protein